MEGNLIQRLIQIFDTLQQFFDDVFVIFYGVSIGGNLVVGCIRSVRIRYFLFCASVA